MERLSLLTRSIGRRLEQAVGAATLESRGRPTWDAWLRDSLAERSSTSNNLGISAAQLF